MKKSVFILLTILISQTYANYIILNEPYQSTNDKNKNEVIDLKSELTFLSENSLILNKLVLKNNTSTEITVKENNKETNEEETSSSSSSKKGPTVSCYWVNTTTLEVWDLSALGRKSSSEVDLTFEYEQRKIAYNFCGNTLAKCNSGPSQVAILQSDGSCAQSLAGKAEDFNLWQMRDPKNNSDGVKITMNAGEACDEKTKHFVTWDLKCNDKLEKGQLKNIEVTRIAENPCFSIKISAETKQCKNINTK